MRTVYLFAMDTVGADLLLDKISWVFVECGAFVTIWDLRLFMEKPEVLD